MSSWFQMNLVLVVERSNCSQDYRYRAPRATTHHFMYHQRVHSTHSIQTAHVWSYIFGKLLIVHVVKPHHFILTSDSIFRDPPELLLCCMLQDAIYRPRSIGLHGFTVSSCLRRL